ncbi:MAG: hypothetical protein MIO92_14250 [Methanosarcinaceae archaeon]|nr:hypothetical protein [Methanosarcinaceae archaeon]
MENFHSKVYTLLAIGIVLVLCFIFNPKIFLLEEGIEVWQGKGKAFIEEQIGAPVYCEKISNRREECYWDNVDLYGIEVEVFRGIFEDGLFIDWDYILDGKEVSTIE